MRKFKNIFTISLFLASINLKSQNKIIQTTELKKNNTDSVIVKTKFETINGKYFLSESKCKKEEVDSISKIDRRRAEKIIRDFGWKN